MYCTCLQMPAKKALPQVSKLASPSCLSFPESNGLGSPSLSHHWQRARQPTRMSLRMAHWRFLAPRTRIILASSHSGASASPARAAPLRGPGRRGRRPPGGPQQPEPESRGRTRSTVTTRTCRECVRGLGPSESAPLEIFESGTSEPAS